MEKGEIDAMSNLDPMMTKLEQDGDIKVIADSRTEEGTRAIFGGSNPAAVMYVKQDFIEKNPATVQAILSNGPALQAIIASHDAVQAIIANPAAVQATRGLNVIITPSFEAYRKIEQARSYAEETYDIAGSLRMAWDALELDPDCANT